MLSFITYRELPEQVELLFDDQGIDDMIFYLQSLKISKDHMHLVIGNELDEYKILPDRVNVVSSVKHVLLEYNPATKS